MVENIDKNPQEGMDEEMVDVVDQLNQLAYDLKDCIAKNKNVELLKGYLYLAIMSAREDHIKFSRAEEAFLSLSKSRMTPEFLAMIDDLDEIEVAKSEAVDGEEFEAAADLRDVEIEQSLKFMKSVLEIRDIFCYSQENDFEIIYCSPSPEIDEVYFKAMAEEI